MGLKDYFRKAKDEFDKGRIEKERKLREESDVIEKHTVGDVNLDEIKEKSSLNSQGLDPNKMNDKIPETPKQEESEKPSETTNNTFQEIINTIQNDFPAEKIYDEKELQAQLRIFLKIKYPNRDVQREVHTDDSILDLLVDQKYAFEVKVPRNRTELRNLRGQIEEYKEHFPNLCVVIYENEDYNMLEDIKKYVEIYKEKYNVQSVVLQGKKRK